MTVTHRLLSTERAALYLGVTVHVLFAWRRRGIGPAYCRLPGAHVYRGSRSWEEKKFGRIAYPIEALDSFWQKMLVQEGRLPRPTPGRMPGGKNRNPHAYGAMSPQ